MGFDLDAFLMQIFVEIRSDSLEEGLVQIASQPSQSSLFWCLRGVLKNTAA